MSRTAALWDEWLAEDPLGDSSIGPYSLGVSEGQAPDPVAIPYSWLNPPIVRRPTTAITKAQIAQSGGATASSSASQALVDQFGANLASTSLLTAVDADPANLASFLTTYQSTPRPRQPVLRLILNDRTDEECERILNVQLTTRVRITDVPSSWPAGAVTFVVEGIRHVIGIDFRSVEWMTSAPIGEVAGTPGPWFRIGESYLGGSDNIPF